MTTSIARELARRKAAPDAAGRTFAGDLLRELNTLVERATHTRFPDPKYAKDPVAFFREVLGVEPWDRQIEILEAVRDYPRVAVCSGHKIGKSTSVSGLALWFYASFSDARAIMSSTTSRQVDQILWRELRMLRARGGRCVACKAADPDAILIPRPCPHSAIIDGEQGDLARTGLKSEDFREIVGFTAREAEAVAGISGRNLLYLMDEASGIPDEIFEAVEGNRAGGARIVLVGNGTRNEGEFFEAFNSKAHLYKTIRISSEETPNVARGTLFIPGLATREWIEEKKLEWGEDSPLYRVRVKGEHATFEEGKIFSLHAIGESEKRWPDTLEAGRLYIGLDPAGPQGNGDESVFCVRRGMKQLHFRAFLGLDPDMHLMQLLGLIREYRLPNETAVVVVDAEGPIGKKTCNRFREYSEEHPTVFDLFTVRASDGAKRDPKEYDRVRDELAANLEQWMRAGGAILEDVKLERELHCLEWTQRVNGKLKLTGKEEVRKAIGRSPDRYDALALSVWEPSSLREEKLSEAALQAIAPETNMYAPLVNDPYAGADLWQK